MISTSMSCTQPYQLEVPWIFITKNGIVTLQCLTRKTHCNLNVLTVTTDNIWATASKTGKIVLKFFFLRQDNDMSCLNIGIR